MRQRRNEKPSLLDKRLLFLTIGLAVVGLLAVADASAPQAMRVFSDPYYFTKQQLMWSVLGLFAMIVVSFVHYSYWEKIAYPIFAFSIILLVVVLLPGFGSKVLGARRWISVGPFGFQPSEFMKFAMALVVAKLYKEDRPFWSYIVVVGLAGFLIMLQPDLGTTIVVVGVAFIQMFVAGLNMFYLLGLGLSGALVGAILILTSSYRKARLLTFLESSSDPLGSSYHIRQVLIALGSGGLLGVGLGQSKQKHLFLPESATDSVFAVVAEEVGFIGAAVVIILLFYFLLRLFRIASRAPDEFSKLLAVGISAWIGVQMILNLSSMVSLTPLTGIPLPFFSYGGSSLTMMLGSIGILLNISKHGKKD